MKKLLCFVLAMILCLGSISAFADVETGEPGDVMYLFGTSTEEDGPVFSDIVSGSVLGDAVYKLVRKNILAGYGDGTFRPNAGLTRAELSKIINLVFNLTEKSSSMPFTDVTEDKWYCEYVSVAVNAGYIKGFPDNTFRGDDPVTREQVCAIINRVTEEQGLGFFDLPFSGNIVDPVSDWALEDVKKIIANYIMPLEAGGKFRATENITRAELVLAVEPFVVELPKYTVTFETNGGDEMESVLVEQGSILSKPEDPVKKNNTFKGWYTDKDLKKEYDFNTFVMSDITLYAKWTPDSTVGVGTGGYRPPSNTTPTDPEPTDPEPTDPGVTNYKVTFNTNGGSDIEAQYVAAGECVAQPEDPVKDMHIFVGWFKDSALTVEYDFSSAVTKNMTLYAKWEEDADALTAQRVADLKLIKEVMNGTTYDNEYMADIKTITVEVIDLVIADGESGINISGDYVAETYGDRISEAKDIYENVMNDSERSEFKSSVITMIYECQARGMKMTVSEVYAYFSYFE